mgnify:CR=1 FL=1
MLIAFSVAPSGTGNVDGSVHAREDPGVQLAWMRSAFRTWMDRVPLPASHKVCTWGNHDFAGEGVDAIRREGLRGPRLLGNALEGGLGKVAGGLEGGDAILQLGIEIDYPLLDGAVEPGELVACVLDLGFECGPAIGKRHILGRLPVDQGLEDDGEAFRRQELLPDRIRDELVQSLRRQVTALADGAALGVVAAAAVVGVASATLGRGPYGSCRPHRCHRSRAPREGSGH